MVDKINGGKGFGPLGGINRTGKPDVAKKSGEAGKADRVDFSSALQQASKTQATEATQQSARAEKLQALKAQIESGTYQPDLEKVAASVLPFIMKDS
ncbi:anti-sigma-28 factor, FlgM family [Malonomonas rubra DSM 5091]|uniref:Negative regulator of flagellin synthesis n=1 Tax=Malonomonas rubra DSM 5091 TaxID=1122189 RepID=A0A1M6MAV1_MALRU|nr:flagellar biosynthesis anti-sigma factor FlgM [Malonomonas rubra]SHJ80544.1 anti-sigma-28 factor, FlgM family [Malonomonas rubra DSM 5091]